MGCACLLRTETKNEYKSKPKKVEEKLDGSEKLRSGIQSQSSRQIIRANVPNTNSRSNNEVRTNSNAIINEIRNNNISSG